MPRQPDHVTFWAVDEAGVVTRGGDPVTAGVVFENQESIRSALGLRFSRQTVSMVIEISGTFPDGLVLRVGVEKNAWPCASVPTNRPSNWRTIPG